MNSLTACLSDSNLPGNDRPLGRSVYDEYCAIIEVSKEAGLQGDEQNKTRMEQLASTALKAADAQIINFNLQQYGKEFRS